MVPLLVPLSDMAFSVLSPPPPSPQPPQRSSFAPGASDFSRAGFPGVGQSKRFAPSPPFAALRRGGHSSRIGSIGSGDAAASPEDVHVATGSGGGGSPMMMIMRQPLQSNRSMQPARIRGATSFNWTGGAAGASKRMSYDAAAERKRSISPSRRGGAAKDVPPATSVAVGGSSRAFSGEGGLSPTNAAGAGSGSPKKRSLRGSATLVGTPYPTSASSATGRLSRTLSSMPPGLSFRPVGSAGVETTEEEDSFLQGMAEEQVAQWRKVILAHVFIYVTWVRHSPRHHATPLQGKCEPPANAACSNGSSRHLSRPPGPLVITCVLSPS